MYETYQPQSIEEEILEFWKRKKILGKLRTKNEHGPKFYFLEGPPYTSGRVHLGTAWNMALKDIILRYKRSRGYHVWDRMGYDMHGLPTEQKVMATLNLKNKEDIETFGLKRFTDACEKFCQEMMLAMNQDFIRLGATLDFSNPYQPITREFMEAEWFLIKTAYEKGRLYQGLRTMHWDAATQTAVAKHELEYKNITDTAIFVKFAHATQKNTFFIVWTTTPWTIPLNLAIMVNPDLTYAEVDVNGETWIMAQDLVSAVLQKAGIKKHKIKKKYFGKELAGQHYLHPLNLKQYLPADLQQNPGLFSVLLSSEFVDASAGTGLVHCAPGCGPEDYEVGHRHGIPPFNCVTEAGYFDNFGPYTQWKAKSDDKKFIQAIDDAGALVAKEPYVHDYPHGERSHQPVIFRTTKQWFFKVEDLKEKMVAANEEIYWHPESAKNAFRSWLENLRDNSITKQRYWGTPVPIWQAAEGDVIVVGSVQELEKLSGKKVTNMHIPAIDEITITKKGKIYHRVPDVLDVWIDAGTVSWNCLEYPVRKDLFKQLFPPDFILEGKDQIRGWFNLLMVASFLAFEKPAFKNVYMHGFLNDVNGIKMSKSLGNIISPDELIQKHGADVLRYYMCQTNAGEDINFSWEEAATKARNLHIFWNIHKLILTLARDTGINPYTLDPILMHDLMSVEEQFIISKLHSTIVRVTNFLEKYHLDEIITPLEDLFLELSRTYVQMVREKTQGEQQDKEIVLYTLSHVFLEGLKMLQIITPFISEAMYQNMKEQFGLKEESLSHYSWPKAQKSNINTTLEAQLLHAHGIIQAALNAREKRKLGVRWPVKELVVVSTTSEIVAAAEQLREIIQKQMNAKSLSVLEHLPGVKTKITPDLRKIGPAFGKLSPQIMALLQHEKPEVLAQALEHGKYVGKINKIAFEITPEMVIREHEVPARFQEAEFKGGYVYLNVEHAAELEAEGYAREITRHVQQLRKEAGLQKPDRIALFIQVSSELSKRLQGFKSEIAEKVGAQKMEISAINSVKKHQQEKEVAIKQEKVRIGFNKV